MVMSLWVFPFLNPSLSLSCAVLLFNRCCLFFRIHSYRFLGPGQLTDFNQLPNVTETLKWQLVMSILIKSSRISWWFNQRLPSFCCYGMMSAHSHPWTSFALCEFQKNPSSRGNMIGQECPDSDFLLYRNSWGESCNAHGSSGNFEDRIEG